MDLDELRDVALEAARAAAEVHQARIGTLLVHDWSEKGAIDFVTEVDIAAEATILETVRRHFPGHAFLAEEETSARGETAHGALISGTEDPDEWLWIVDPLDGTTNFLHGYPMYAASVAVAHHGEVVAGAVVLSPTGEAWTATKGGGAFKDGLPIRVSAIDELRYALVGTGFPFKAQQLLPLYVRQFEAALRATSGVRRAGAAAVDLCHVASGWFDGFWELDLLPWDIAAGMLIAREAGGVVTTLAGEEPGLGRVSVLAGNPAIHGKLGEFLRGIG